MAKGTLFIVSAPSGAGKSSLINALLKKFNTDDSMRLSISHTTREPRPGEVDHVSYHFVSVEEFESLIERGAFFEHAKVFDNYYGTSKEIVMDWINQGKDVFFDIDWQGARLIKEQVPEAVKIFILPPSLKVLQSRLEKRGQDAPEVIHKRMTKAMSEISHYNEYDYVIINDDFDDSLISLRSIVLSHRSTLKHISQTHAQMFEDMKLQEQEIEQAWLARASALEEAAANTSENPATASTATDATPASQEATACCSATSESESDCNEDASDTEHCGCNAAATSESSCCNSTAEAAQSCTSDSQATSACDAQGAQEPSKAE